MLEIPIVKNLEPYFKLAANKAKESPCVRRQYAALIVGTHQGLSPTVQVNSRIGGCCSDSTCARTRAQLRNGERVEVGAEIHAETAAVIAHGPKVWPDTYVLLVGFSGPRELLGTEVYPCHTCAINLKFAGFDWIYVRDYRKQIVPVSISEIMEFREAEWDYDG